MQSQEAVSSEFKPRHTANENARVLVTRGSRKRKGDDVIVAISGAPTESGIGREKRSRVSPDADVDMRRGRSSRAVAAQQEEEVEEDENPAPRRSGRHRGSPETGSANTSPRSSTANLTNASAGGKMRTSLTQRKRSPSTSSTLGPTHSSSFSSGSSATAVSDRGTSEPKDTDALEGERELVLAEEYDLPKRGTRARKVSSKKVLELEEVEAKKRTMSALSGAKNRGSKTSRGSRLLRRLSGSLRPDHHAGYDRSSFAKALYIANRFCCPQSSALPIFPFTLYPPCLLLIPIPVYHRLIPSQQFCLSIPIIMTLLFHPFIPSTIVSSVLVRVILTCILLLRFSAPTCEA
jgi:hypothetical protein